MGYNRVVFIYKIKTPLPPSITILSHALKLPFKILYNFIFTHVNSKISCCCSLSFLSLKPQFIILKYKLGFPYLIIIKGRASTVFFYMPPFLPSKHIITPRVLLPLPLYFLFVPLTLLVKLLLVPLLMLLNLVYQLFVLHTYMLLCKQKNNIPDFYVIWKTDYHIFYMFLVHPLYYSESKSSIYLQTQINSCVNFIPQTYNYPATLGSLLYPPTALGLAGFLPRFSKVATVLPRVNPPAKSLISLRVFFEGSQRSIRAISKPPVPRVYHHTIGYLGCQGLLIISGIFLFSSAFQKLLLFTFCSFTPRSIRWAD